MAVRSPATLGTPAPEFDKEASTLADAFRAVDVRDPDLRWHHILLPLAKFVERWRDDGAITRAGLFVREAEGRLSLCTYHLYVAWARHLKPVVGELWGRVHSLLRLMTEATSEDAFNTFLQYFLCLLKHSPQLKPGVGEKVSRYFLSNYVADSFYSTSQSVGVCVGEEGRCVLWWWI